MNVLLLAGLALASANGLEEARRTCDRFPAYAEYMACQGIVSRSEHFDAALQAHCGRMTRANDILDCMDAVADKDYSDADRSLCLAQHRLPETMKCLKEMGRERRLCRRPAMPLHRLRELRRKVDNGDKAGALNDLDELIRSLEQK